RIVIPRVAAIRILGTAVFFPVLAVLAAPIVAVVTHFNGIPNYGTQYSLVAEAAGKVWRETTDEPLRLIGSYDNVPNGSGLLLSGSTIDVRSRDPGPDAVGR